MDRFAIDSHKLMYHPERVSRFLSGKTVYPVYVEISPSGICNYRCAFCAFDFLGYKKRFIDGGKLITRLKEMGRLGVKSVMYAGEGEPLLHPDIARIIKNTAASGIDAAVTSNGLLFRPKLAEKILPYLSWFRISLNAGTPATYASLHGTDEKSYSQVLENIKSAVEIRNRKKLKAAIGAQCLLLPENREEIEGLALELRRRGADYLIVKPYSQHPKSITRKYAGLDYRKFQELEKRIKRIETEGFSIVFRTAAMGRFLKAREYGICYGLHFWAYINAAGELYACFVHLGDKRFLYGSILKSSFEKIWNGPVREKFIRFMGRYDFSKCRKACRMDAVNEYLWRLKNPPAHVNFI